MSFLGFGEKVRDFTVNKDGGDTINADGLDRVGDGAVGRETLGEVEGNLDNCFNGGPPLQILMESRVVADFCVDLTEGNIFKMRSVLFAFMVCACKFCESDGKNLLLVDHHEAEFVQGGRKVVRREAHSIEDIVDRIVVWCENEQLGAFLIAADLSSHIVGQSRSHLDIIWRKFVAPRRQAGRPMEKTYSEQW